MLSENKNQFAYLMLSVLSSDGDSNRGSACKSLVFWEFSIPSGTKLLQSEWLEIAVPMESTNNGRDNIYKKNKYHEQEKSREMNIRAQTLNNKIKLEKINKQV